MCNDAVDPEGEDPSPPVLFEEEKEGLAARAVPGRGSDVLVVVFSQVRVPQGSFGLSRLFARTRHACLFLNQPKNAWYRGLDGHIDRLVDRAADAVAPSRIVLYGSSMGAFAAAAAAARRPEADLVAFAPDFRIGEPSSRSAAAGLPTVDGEADLSTLLQRAGPGGRSVLLGLYDPYDAGTLAGLQAQGVAGLVPVAGAHEIHDQLYSVNVIRRIITTFTRDPAQAVAERGLFLPVPDLEPYRRFAALAADLQAGGAPDPAEIAALGLAANPGAMRLEAEASARRGAPARAEAVLARLQVEIDGSEALSTLPKRYRKAVFRRRIELLEALGERSAAADLTAEAARRFPTDADFAAASRRS